MPRIDPRFVAPRLLLVLNRRIRYVIPMHSVTVSALFLMSLASAIACPWCNSNEVQKPTVLPNTPDPGGKFFGHPPDVARTRRYFIAAEPVTWNFLPKRQDPVGKSLIPEYVRAFASAIKLRYVQYTDESFSVRVTQPRHLGILGPVLRGVTGEFLSVTFLNRTDRPLSIHPHGVKYDKDSEGASYFPERGLGAAIAPQASFTYVWHIDEAAGPAPSEPSSKAWLYHSHVLADQEINLGLVGFIVVTDAARARPDGTPKDVDRELATAFVVFDEMFRESEDLYSVPLPPDPGARTNFIFHRTVEAVREMEMRERFARHSVNGLIFGNLDGLEMVSGERVRWYLFALGSEKDLHTAHWHGVRVTARGLRTDVVELLPGSMVVADLVADNVGSWLFHCHVADHMMEGMYAPFVVHPMGHHLESSPNRFYSTSTSGPSIVFNSASAVLETNKILQLSFSGSIQLLNPLRISDLPVGLVLGTNQFRFDLDQNGKGAASNALFYLGGFRSMGGGFGGLLEFNVSASSIFLPFQGSSIPVELRLGASQMLGRLQLISAGTNKAHAVLGAE